jgi:hypothetical protein
MQFMFAFGMEECFSQVPALNRSSSCVRVALQDDSYIFGNGSTIAENWQSLKAALSAGGHELRDIKCKAWSPLCDNLDDNELPAWLKALHDVVPRSRGGLVLLGGAAQGEMETAIGDQTFLLQKAAARAQQAIKLAARVRTFVSAQPSTTSAHQGWFVLAKSVAFALSYDARLIPSQVLAEIAEPVGRELVTSALMVLGCVERDWESTVDVREQLRLPGRFGGLGVRLIAEGLHADATFWAAWLAMSKAVPVFAQALGLVLVHVQAQLMQQQLRIDCGRQACVWTSWGESDTTVQSRQYMRMAHGSATRVHSSLVLTR